MAGSADEDDLLVARCAGGDADALRRLIERHGRAAHALALHIARDPAAAEEITQDAFLRVWRGARRYTPQGLFRAWLLRVVRHLALDHLRRRRPPAPWSGGAAAAAGPGFAAPDPADPLPGPEDQAEAAETGRALASLLAALPPEQRRVVELLYYAGLSHREAARRLGIPLGTLKGRVRLALDRLRREFPPLGGVPW